MVRKTGTENRGTRKWSGLMTSVSGAWVIGLSVLLINEVKNECGTADWADAAPFVKRTALRQLTQLFHIRFF